MNHLRFQNENIEKLVKLGYWEWWPTSNEANFSQGFINMFSFVDKNISLQKLLLYLDKNCTNKIYIDLIRYFNELQKGKIPKPKTFTLHFDNQSTRHFEISAIVSKIENSTCIAGTVQEITERIKYEILKDKEIKFEKKISEMTSHFINDSNFEASISNTLDELGQLCNADRVSLIKIENNSISKQFEWKSKIDTKNNCCFILNNLPSSEIKYFIDLIKEKKLVYFHSPSDLPGSMTQFKINVDETNINSLIIAGLQKDIQTIGALVISRTNKFEKWDFSDIHMVKMTSLIIGNALKQSILSKNLKENERRLKFALIAGKLGTYELDLQTENRFVDDRIAKIIGYQSGTLNRIENWFQNHLHIDHIADYDDCMTQCLDGNNNFFEMQYRLKCKDGSYKWVSDWGIVTEISNDGDPIKMVGIMQDISLRKNTEKALRDAKEKAEENEKLKTAFLANVSHEIRTPMNGISGFAELLYNNMISDDEKHHYLEIIWKNSNRLLNLINNILDISKLETNQLTIYEREYCLNKLVEELSAKYNDKAEQIPNIKLSIQLKVDKQLCCVNIDDARVKQVLINLVDNAYKFTTTGSIKVCIEINNDNLYQFSIKDTGIGISRKFQQKLFNRFSQSDTTINQNIGGSGLGLPISKGLIQTMGGKIWVKSLRGVGSTFYFTLPCKPTKALKLN
ncbi:MAG: ATP-binding protein [Salinivirgaceae bacterium]|jgi:PAS domain S-box-containing protein|nr:ATP-binding protein [Salinivirgaceae bacterium]